MSASQVVHFHEILSSGPERHSTTATVRRETHTSRSRGSRISMLHTWLRAPRWNGRAVPITMPSDTGRR